MILIVTLTSCLYFGLSALIPCRPLEDITYFDNVCDNDKANATIPVTLFCADVPLYFDVDLVEHLLQ